MIGGGFLLGEGRSRLYVSMRDLYHVYQIARKRKSQEGEIEMDRGKNSAVSRVARWDSQP